MKIITSIRKMLEYSKRMKGGDRKIGFVPTMGYLHSGHLSLVRQAKKDSDIVVMSIFVNPTQFGPREDYKKYPRDFKRDEKLAKAEGVDVIFYPSANKMYPRDYCTYINVENLTEGLCGRFRPGHFRGVATVVTKLFNIVRPDIAYFGQKDAQQAIVIKQLTKDLNLPVKIKTIPIVRERNGLAMSSRNRYLGPDERKDAAILYRALQKAKKLIKSGERNPHKVKAVIKAVIDSVRRKLKIEYVSIVDINNLKDIKKIKGTALIAVAAWRGETRLIDNIIVKAGA